MLLVQPCPWFLSKPSTSGGILYSPCSYQICLFAWRLPVSYLSSAESVSTVTSSSISIQNANFFSSPKVTINFLVRPHIKNMKFYPVSNVKTNRLDISYSPLFGSSAPMNAWEAALDDSLRMDAFVIKVYLILSASQFLSIAYSKRLVANSQISHISF